MATLTFPRVSVVIPVKNGENYLQNCLTSVLEQNYPNIEIIVGINPSDDNTVQIAKNILGVDHQGVIEFTNSVNMPENFNRTARLATGKYIKFLCHDDLLAPDAIIRLVEYFESNSGVVLVTSFEGFIPPTEDSRSESSFGIDDKVNRVKCYYRFARYGNWIGGPSGVMIRQSIFFSEKFDSQNVCAFDVDYWIRLCRYGNIGIVRNILYYSRRHSGQATNRCANGGFLKDFRRAVSRQGIMFGIFFRLINFRFTTLCFDKVKQIYTLVKTW